MKFALEDEYNKYGCVILDKKVEILDAHSRALMLDDATVMEFDELVVVH